MTKRPLTNHELIAMETRARQSFVPDEINKSGHMTLPIHDLTGQEIGLGLCVMDENGKGWPPAIFVMRAPVEKVKVDQNAEKKRAEHDAEFFTHARSDILRLVEEVRRLQALVGQISN